MRSTKPKEDGLVDSARIASYCDVSVRTVQLWAERGVIPVALRVGRVIRFELYEVATHKSAFSDLVEF